MEIRLNGDTYGFNDGASVAALVQALKLDTKKIAVEVNLAIVPRSNYEDTLLQPGDAVEIVRFIGGG